ncbi:CRTAC1 family protein [Mucilaginibacter ginsenosidivorax]|uniref:CRTAC1 family protein n=2 Tax=Mucilaginibacter ginsenosidivorax TaxID=862126 RepID=A0A5B8W7P1_9SPHI|nr:CRTAC1 family protein [Mucilaginibacter ginsenosidivorax]
MLSRFARITMFFAACTCGLILSCKPHSPMKMADLLQQLKKRNYNPQNVFSSDARLAACDSALKADSPNYDVQLLSKKALFELQEGHEQQAVDIYSKIAKLPRYMNPINTLPDQAVAFMRLGERANCMLGHNGASCIFPIKGAGIHQAQTGSQQAIETLQSILKSNSQDAQSRWLLNIAYMTLGRYPDQVPAQYLIPNLNADDGPHKVKPFTDVAANVGINLNSRAGGSIADDFDGDGYIDIITSGMDLQDHMHYFHNNGDGTFSDRTAQSGLQDEVGGLNIQQTDYNNDGRPDIFIMRGGWLRDGFGNQPGSLLKNNGNGKFTDVTIAAGLQFMHPTQTAVWADFNNDGWLDVFIGMESHGGTDPNNNHPSALYMNNHDGTFKEMAQKAHCQINDFVKGVTSADYNNDGWPDIFLSTMSGRKYLLKNKCKGGNNVDFDDVTEKAGINIKQNTFTTWFFDYNNDGWPDILLGSYNFSTTLGYYAALEALGTPVADNGNIFLFKNNRDGTFTNVTHDVGLNKAVFSMGGNFGDIDNDGYPDIYFGTGNPDFGSLIPNKLFRNIAGKKFADVTSSSRTGNLQKGHGVSFADFRNNGLQDIFIEMGGAYIGDAYKSALYLNPGQNNNSWIGLKLVGTRSNKSAIGSRIKVTFTENGIQRSVFKDVNSGGSFGSSPLRQEIGVGQAKMIDDIEIRWAGSGILQHFYDVKPNQFLEITEDGKLTPLNLKALKFNTGEPAMQMQMADM